MTGLPGIPSGAGGSRNRLDELAERARRDAEQGQSPAADADAATQQTGAPAERAAGRTGTRPQDEPATATGETGQAETEEAQDASTGPVGQGDYVVRQGDCMASIAKETGHFWETIWNDAANSELRDVRENPNILYPGDRVTIPEIRPKQEPGETEMRHRFVRRGEPVWLRLHLRSDGEPIANEPYVLEVGDQQREGTTDADGLLQEQIPPQARRAVLRIRDTEHELKVGHLNPDTANSGIRGRLNNLGYDAGGGDSDELDEKLSAALRQFQADSDLSVTGVVDEETRARLCQEHEV